MDAAAAQGLKASELLGRLVLNLDTAEAVGSISRILVDTQRHRVGNLVVSAGLLGQTHQLLSWGQISSIGPDSLVVKLGQETRSDRPEPGQMVGGLELWSNAGERVGRIVDYCIDGKTGAIQRYLYAPEGHQNLADGIYAFYPAAIISSGQKRMMIQAAAVETPSLYEPRTSVSSQAQGFPQVDGAQALQDWETARQKGQALASEVQTQAHRLASQAKGHLDQTLNQVQRRSRKLRGQLRETVADVSTYLPHQEPTPPPKAPTVDITALEDLAETFKAEDGPTSAGNG